MKNALTINVIVAACFIMLTCSEPPELVPGPTPGPTPGPKLTLTDEERLAVLKECSQFTDLLGDLTPEATQEIVVAWFKSRPEFKDAGIATKNVWASFHDGRLVTIIPNWEGAEETVGGRIATDESSGRMESAASDARASALPGSSTMILFHALGRGFMDDRPFLKNLISSSHTDYLVNLQDASIDNLKAVNDLGVFYIRTHGGVANRGGTPVFMLWTTDSTSVANEQKYLPEWNSNMLVYCLAKKDVDQKDEWHYGITSEFVRHSRYMNFAADAFLYIDGCNGMTSEADQFRTSMIGEAANDKATYIGWTAPKSWYAGNPTARFVFDRLLGTHDQSNNSIEPVQRPFDWPSIFDDLFTFGLGVSEHGGRLAYSSIYNTEPILTPSIEYIWMDDYDSKMVIKGFFGEDFQYATVMVDGIAASNIIWSPTLVIAEIPTKGKGSHGDVVVSIRGHESNKVPLSLWTIPMNLSVDDMGVTTEAIINLKIRADVHPYRTKSGEQPRNIRPDSLDMLSDPKILGWLFNTSSTGTYSVAGQRQVSCTLDGGCYVRDTEWVINKSANLPYDALGSGLGFRAYYKWAEDMKTIYVKVYATIPNVGMEFELYGKCPDKDAVTVNRSYASTLGVSIPTEGIDQLQIKLDDNHKIMSDRATKTRFLDWGRCQTTSRIITTASWSAATPESAPKPDTDARAMSEP